MFCSKCGKELEEGSNFCEFCGAPLQETLKERKQLPQADNKSVNKKHNSLWILGVVSVLIIVVIGGIFLLKKGEQRGDAAQTAVATTANPEDQLFEEYRTACNDIKSETEEKESLLLEAENLIADTSGNMVTDTAVLSNLAATVQDVREQGSYQPEELNKGSEQINEELIRIQQARSDNENAIRILQEGIERVQGSISERQQIIEEEKNKKLWPGTTYTVETKDANGYVVEVKMKFGSWIKASDKENLNKAWQKAGGEGEAPDVSTFKLNNYTFKDNSAVMTFATLEYTNKTEGYDFSEQYPYACNATYCTRLDIPSNSNLGGWQGKIYFSNGPSDMNRSGFSFSTVSMKKNHWGPVTIAFAVENVFTPNFDSNGNPAIDEVTFSFGGNSIRIPSIWKTVTPIGIAESDSFIPWHYDEVGWELRPGGITDAGWAEDWNKSENGYSLVLERYRYSAHYNKGGNSEMSINLSQLYTDFQGDITVSAESKDNQGILKVQIYGDGALLWESKDITGQSEDVHFDVDVTDVRKLEIKAVTDEADPGPSVAIINDIIS